ncbi:MAG TPA: polysaccharide deacetylase family protein, partial [Chroococcidiopsis sp.]
IVRRGHELGNHLTEDRPSIRLSPEAFEADLVAAERVIAPFIPFTTSTHADPLRWLRPASGWYNATMIRIATKHGYRVALGSIFPFDTHIASVGFCVLHIRLNAAPGSIIVLHDSGAWGDRTALTLEKVLPLLIRRGYQIVSLSELVGLS